MDHMPERGFKEKWLLNADRPLWPVLLIMTIALFLLLALRSGQEWDGDFALYIMNAKNIALGLPYAKTDYIFNPEHAVSPAAYPQGLPLLLAPLYAIFGLDLVKMKIACIAAFILFLVVFYRIARRAVSPTFALAVTAAIGVHPFIVDSENSLGSEYLFMFFCYAALDQLDRLEQTQARTPWIAVLAIGATALTVACAYLTRSAGAVLFPAALISIYYSKRLLSKTTGALVGAAVIIAAIQFTYPADVGTYVHYFDRFTFHGVLTSIKRYLSVRTALLGTATDDYPGISVILASVLVLFGLVGFIERVRSRTSVFESFFLLYILLLLVFPITVEAARYSMPLWPLLFLYCAIGITICRRWLSQRSQQVMAAVVFLTLIALYGWQYASTGFGPIPFSVDAPPSQGLLDAIRTKLGKDDRLLTRKPTIIALYTGHEATVWPEGFTDDDLWSYMARLKVRFVVQDIYHLGVHKVASDPLDAFIRRNRADLEPIFTNAWFNLYRVAPSRNPLSLKESSASTAQLTD
jgi:Dolichyl-phosphate-mannose-protein mannosyltransferase